MMSVESDINDEVFEQKMDTEVQRSIVSVVPWYNAAQFRKVYQYLYCNDVTKKRWALDQIAVWESRCHPSLPAAIEASFVLTSAIVQDVLWTNHTSTNQHVDIQCIYSSAITRFVNLTVDIHEEHLHLRATMTNLAKGIGIPKFIVDLRHEASHSVRPSLAYLRMAAESAMQYLRDSYWEIEASRVKNFVKKPINEEEIRDLICAYVKCQLCILLNKQVKFPTDDTEYLSELDKCLKQIERVIKSNKRLFIKVLTSEGIFIPFEEDFKVMCLDEEEFKLFQAEDNSIRRSDYLPSQSSVMIPNIPEMHETLWKPVIFELNIYDAVPLLMESLLKSQANRTVIGQKLLISWVMRILRIHATGGRHENTCLKKIFKWKSITPSWRSMFYSAVSNPCIYTPFVLPLIYCHLNGSKRKTQGILHLLAIHLGQIEDDSLNLPKNPTIFTVEQLHRNKVKQKALEKAEKENEKRKQNSEECVWSSVLDEHYKTWPIGHINDAVDPEENKEQAEDVKSEGYCENEDFVEKFIIGNENDKEEYSEWVDHRLDTLDADITKELKERKSFLYKK